jgi:hypothetical protein
LLLTINSQKCIKINDRRDQEKYAKRRTNTVKWEKKRMKQTVTYKNTNKQKERGRDGELSKKKDREKRGRRNRKKGKKKNERRYMQKHKEDRNINKRKKKERIP